MRYREIIAESHIYRVPVADGTGLVLHNPGRRVFEKFAADRHNNLRGLLTYEGDDVWLWAAYNATHAMIRDELGLGRIEYLYYRSGRWIMQSGNSNLIDDQTGLYVPAIQRITPREIDWNADAELLNQLMA